MGFFMRCNHVYPNGKKCRSESPYNQSALQGNDWYIEPTIGGTLTICPKCKGPYVMKQVRRNARKAAIAARVEDYRRRIEMEGLLDDSVVITTAKEMAEAAHEGLKRASKGKPRKVKFPRLSKKLAEQIRANLASPKR